MSRNVDDGGATPKQQGALPSVTSPTSSAPQGGSFTIPPAATVLPRSLGGTDLTNVIPRDSIQAFRGLKHLPVRTVERVSKINKVGRHQDRVLVVTSTHIYSALPSDGDVQRCITLALLGEVRFYKARLEAAFIVPADLLVQFYDPKSLLRVLACCKEYSSAKIVEEPTPIEYLALALEKPEQFARAPLPVPVTSFPPWSARAHKPSGDRRRKHAPPVPLEGANGDHADASSQPDLDGHQALEAPSGDSQFRSQAGGWQALQPIEVEPAAPEIRSDTAARSQKHSGEGSIGASGSASPTTLRVAPRPAFENAQAPDEGPASRAAPSSPRMFGGGKRGQGAPASRPAFNEDDRDDLGSTAASSPGSAALRRGGPANNETSASVTALKAELAASEEALRSVTRTFTEALRAKAAQEAGLRSELDSLRRVIDQLTAENLRLRRPWALDL